MSYDLSNADQQLLARVKLTPPEKETVAGYWMEHPEESTSARVKFFIVMTEAFFLSSFLIYFATAFVEIPSQIANLSYFSMLILGLLLFFVSLILPLAVAGTDEKTPEKLLSRGFIRLLATRNLWSRFKSYSMYSCVVGGAVLNGHFVTAIIFLVLFAINAFSLEMARHGVSNTVKRMTEQNVQRSNSARLVNI